jgi:hypothetical protein
MKEWGWTNPVLADEAGGVRIPVPTLVAFRNGGSNRRS